MTDFFTVGSLEYIVVNWISLICALTVVVTILLLKKMQPWAVARVTVNLHAGVALMGAMRHICFLITPPESNNSCQMLAFMAFFTGHMSLFLNMAIAFNLQRIYIHECQPQEQWRWILYILPIVVALFLDLIPIPLQAFGREHYGTCYLDKDSPYRTIMMTLLIYSTRIPGYIYCFIVFLLVVLKLKKPHNALADNQTLNSIHIVSSRKLALRTSLYPLSCFLSHFGGMLSNVLFAFGCPRYDFIRIWVLMGLSTIGLVNLVVFLFDPAFEIALKSSSNIEPCIADQTFQDSDPLIGYSFPSNYW
ncbi:hypothetical protein DSO57_1038570 [Entomophthora muscae]|uniref:Uncharacterized protein n=2 Tax=Entomophthora muscae TaxID=34485 RepID=A0ACC2TL10_9FUNG|nr:hypothetical protein DSO57_1038570 [Entomophthora muscae]